MKKLITIMASMATCLLFGDGFTNSGTSFEDYAPGGKTIADLTEVGDDGKDTGSYRYWFYEGDKNVAIGVITNGTPDAPSRPTQFGNTNTNYLDLTASDATNVFYRAINNVAGKSSVASLDGESIGNGLYLDTLVKFTPTESTNDFTLASGDKLAITYCEETEGDGALSNIVVCAGYVANGVATEKTYVMEIPEDLKASFVATNWHRLTVRAIDVGYSAAPVGFVIYLDGHPDPLTYAVGEAAGDSTYTDALAGNAIVNQFLYNSTTHALLPSAVSSGTAKTTLAAVGFKGNGCVDDISFVSGTPEFVEEGKGVAIEWDAGVATVTVRDGDTYYVGSALGGEDVTALEYSATNFTVESSVLSLTVIATYKGGYEPDTWEPGSGSTYSAENDTLSLASEGETTLSIKSLLPKFEVNGVNYGSFGDALAAAVAASKTTDPWTSVTIKALADIVEGISFTDGDIVLDLNGRTLRGTVEEFTINNSGAILTIIDSASGGTVVAPSGGASRGALYMDDGATVINGGQFDGYVITQKMDEGEGADDLTLNGGVFADSLYDPTDVEAKFYLYDYLGDGVKATYNAGYFTVGTPAPEPTTYAISWSLTGGTTEATAGDFEENDTIVFTADTGKTLSYVLIDGVEDTSAYGETSYTYTVGTDDAELVVTFTTPATPTYAISWTLTGGTTEATAGDFEEDDTIVFTAESGKTLSYVEIDGVEDSSAYGASSYTYTVGTAAATLVVTFTGSSYPSYIDDPTKQAKYDTWKSDMAAAGVDVGDGVTYEDAFLLNCKPAEVAAAKAAFKITSISYDTTQEKWVVTYTDGYNERKYNGTVTVKQYSDVGCKTESSTGTFFRATLD